VISLIALFVAASGTAWGIASNSVDSRQLRNESVRSVDLRNNAAVRSADVVNNALRGQDILETSLDGLLRSDGCAVGKLRGFARINASPLVPDAYTASPLFVDLAHNCSGGSVEVRRASVGHYLVRFNGAGATLAIVSSNTDLTNVGENNIVAAGRVAAGPDAGAFEVTVANEPDNSFEDGPFAILLP
jgi:hypothetical protein